MEEKEQGKWSTEDEQTENSKIVANSLDNYVQIKEDRGKETTKLDIRGHWKVETASQGNSFQGLGTK